MESLDDSYYRALHVAERIEEVRQKKKISRSEFSRRLGRTKAYWSVIFNGAIMQRIGTINNMAKTLNISMEYIIYGNNYGPYEDKKIDIMKITEATHGKTIHLSDSEKSVVSRIRHGKQKDIGIIMYFQIEDKLRTNLLNIITNC